MQKVGESKQFIELSVTQLLIIDFRHVVLRNIAKGTTDPRVEFISQVAHKS